jgi:hypothetical protein
VLTVAKANPRTTIAGIVGLLSLAAGMLATYKGGAWWPVLLGVAVKAAADALGHALAQDGGKDIIP